jgi:hypothetical protein
MKKRNHEKEWRARKWPRRHEYDAFGVSGTYSGMRAFGTNANLLREDDTDTSP